jgi:hypothetical protein
MGKARQSWTNRSAQTLSRPRVGASQSSMLPRGHHEYERYSQQHILVALNLPRRIPDLIAYAKSIVTAMTGNPTFPNPSPTLATLEVDITALDTAESAVLTRTKGAAAARNVKLATVRSDMDLTRAYVQPVANTNPAKAESVIHSSGMAVKKITLRNKADLAAVAGSVPGSAHLVAKAAGHRAAYEWQYSTDQKTWNRAPPEGRRGDVVGGGERERGGGHGRGLRGGALRGLRIRFRVHRSARGVRGWRNEANCGRILSDASRALSRPRRQVRPASPARVAPCDCGLSFRADRTSGGQSAGVRRASVAASEGQRRVALGRCVSFAVLASETFGVSAAHTASPSSQPPGGRSWDLLTTRARLGVNLTYTARGACGEPKTSPR